MTNHHTSTRRSLAAFVGMLLVAAPLAACGDDDDSADDGEATTTQAPTEDTAGDDGDTGGEPAQLTIGYIPSASLAPALIPEELGCLEGENVELEYESVSPADAIALLGQGSLDAYVGSPSAAMFNQVAAGNNIRQVASLGSIATPEGQDAPSGVFVRSALVESGEVTDVADLAGRRIGAIGAVGTATSYIIARVLEEGGLTLADVELVTMSLPDVVPALENGGVDAAYITAPYTVQALEAGIAEPIVDDKAVYGDDTTSGIMFGPSLLEDDREAGAAYLRGAVCVAERMQEDYRTDDELIAALAAFLEAPEDTVRGGALYAFDPALEPNADTLVRMQEVFLDAGEVLTYDEVIPASELTDEDLREEALG